ncbi:hypothetical protein FRB99_001634 [Tulasnella sp. 403]|nr:hypothetical protein FRB99_001634 [Tulasnella sp. 403]
MRTTMLLTAEEKAALATQLNQIDSSLLELYHEELQLSARLRNIHLERQSILGQRNRILNISRSPAVALPNETLSDIFTLVCANPDPWISQRRATAISHVCHRWREAAISTPGLWTYVNMREGPPYEKSATHLERSGACPLIVHIDLTQLRRFTHHERTFITHILVPNLYRCKIFHLSATAMEPFWLALPRFVTRPATVLETLEVFHLATDESPEYDGQDGLWPEEEILDFRAFGGHAPKLRAMTISGLHVPWRTFDVEGLTSFAFDFHSLDVKRSLTTFYDILRASTGLKALTVMQGGSSLRISPNWLAEHSLTGLSTSGSQQNSKFERIALPALEELVYTFAETGLACDIFSLVSTPNIHSLTLEYIKNDCAPLLELMAGPPPLFPVLTNLRLVGLTSIGPGRMLHFLRNAAKNVVTLHVNAVNCPTLKEIAFLLRWMALERREYLIPKLQEISSSGLSPRNLREMIQSRPVEIRPKKIFMRRRDWIVPDDECMAWLKDKVDVQLVEGSSDDEDDD